MPARNRLPVQCAHCGATLERTPYEISRAQRVFCDRTCKDAHQRTHGSGEGNNAYGWRKGAPLTCEACGVTFYRAPCMKARFCSKGCYESRRGDVLRGHTKSAAMRAKLSAAKTGVPNLKRRKSPIPMTCQQCRQPFELSTKRRGIVDKTRFCSTACWYEYIRQHPDEHANYRDGNAQPYGPNWTEQRRLARERDGHTCQECGVRSRRPALDVHHIEPRRLFGDDYLTANRLENLVTLCRACHIRREAELTIELHFRTFPS